MLKLEIHIFIRKSLLKEAEVSFLNMLCVKRTYNAINKQIHSQYLCTSMSSVKRSYYATNKQVPSEYLLTNMSPVKRSYDGTNKQAHSE